MCWRVLPLGAVAYGYFITSRDFFKSVATITNKGAISCNSSEEPKIKNTTSGSNS
jgi:hypothetical protein